MQCHSKNDHADNKDRTAEHHRPRDAGQRPPARPPRQGILRRQLLRPPRDSFPIPMTLEAARCYRRRNRPVTEPAKGGNGSNREHAAHLCRYRKPLHTDASRTLRCFGHDDHRDSGQRHQPDVAHWMKVKRRGSGAYSTNSPGEQAVPPAETADVGNCRHRGRTGLPGDRRRLDDSRGGGAGEDAG